MNLKKSVNLVKLTFLDKYKAKNKVLELKIDKLFRLLRQHAFDPDAIPDDFEGKLSIEIKDERNKPEASASSRRSTFIEFMVRHYFWRLEFNQTNRSNKSSVFKLGN